MGLAHPETYRQSLIAAFDSCPRRALFGLLDERRSPSPLAARGTLFHRWAHQAIELMRANGEDSMPIENGMELLLDVIAQKDVPSEEIVPLKMSEMRWLRVLVAKWCYSTQISVRNIVDVERRLYAELTLPGGLGTRTITGQLDLLLAGPGAATATSIDQKTGFARPPQPRQGDENGNSDRGLTELGWVQSLIYAFLVFANFPSIERFFFREWHVLWGEAREVMIDRYEVERMTDVLAAQVALMDQAITEGVNSPRWVESPGPHCAMCPRPRECPIREQIAFPTNEAEARRTAQEWMVAMEVRKDRTPYLKGWVDAHGPIEVPYSKGRRYVGWNTHPDGSRNFGLYEPREDTASFDERLEREAREAGVLAE